MTALARKPWFDWKYELFPDFLTNFESICEHMLVIAESKNLGNAKGAHFRNLMEMRKRSNTMRDAAIGIVFSHNQSEILLIKRRDIPVWVLPGGGIDENELPEEAAVREVKEETGLSVEIIRKSAEYSPINKLANLTHVFVCRPISGSLQPSDEAKKAAFFPLNNLPNRLFELHCLWINDALEGKSFTIKKPLNQVTYKNLLIYFMKHPLIVIRTLISRLGLPWNS